MKLFSEKVTPTFTNPDYNTPTTTNTNYNILILNEYTEIFFDVYELEINGNKYITEKVSEYKGNPVVVIPVVYEGKELETLFVLRRGELEVLINSLYCELNKDTSFDVPYIHEAPSQEEEVEAIIFEKKESILKEIQQTRKLATQFAENIKREKIQESLESINEEREAVTSKITELKKELVEDFLHIVENTRQELYNYTEQEKKQTAKLISKTLNSLSEKLESNLLTDVAKQTNKSVVFFEQKIKELAQNILSNSLIKEIEQRDEIKNKAIDVKFETVSKSLSKILNEQVSSALSDYDKTILTLEQTNVELNNNIIKSSNKALSRIGSVKTQLETVITDTAVSLQDKIALTEGKIKDYYDGRISVIKSDIADITTDNKTNFNKIVEIDKQSNKTSSRLNSVKTQLEAAITDATVNLIDKITLAEDRIKDYYDERITLIEGNITDTTTENKEYFIKLIKESKQSILDEVSQIKTGVPSVVIEKTREVKGDVDVKSIKTDLEKTISNRFTQELANVRRLIEMSSGGGSVAVQFANGGTMRGNLNVIGDISATGVIYNNNFNSINWNDTYTSVSTTSSNWNNTYTTVNANSANWDTGYNVAIALSLSSGLWNNTYTSVSNTSANWDSAYTIASTYQTASSTFATIDYTNATFFHLTGGTITGDTKVKFGDLTVYGNISATGSVNYANTFVSTTSSLCALANTTYPIPGLYVSQAGTGDIATFYDVSSEREVLHIGGSEGYPGVGINTSLPNKDFTVVGEISATGIIYNNNFSSNDWNNTYTTVQANSATTWNYQGDDLKALSGNWQSTYNNLSTYYPLTGGTVNGSISATGNISTTGIIAASGSDVKINIINVSNSRVFTNADNNKVVHLDTTTSSLCAIFPDTLSSGFNVAIMNVGTNTLVLSAAQLNSAGTTIVTKFGGAFVYKDSASLFAVGRLL